MVKEINHELVNIIKEKSLENKGSTIFVLPEYSNFDIKIENAEIFPDFDIFPFEEMDISSKVKSLRLRTLFSAATSSKVTILTSLHALTRFSIPKENFYFRKYRIGDSFEENLYDIGYQSSFRSTVSAVHSHGEYARRGFIRDIFIPIYDNPLRLELFDNQIERISFFDPNTQKSVSEIEEFIMVAGSESFKSPENISFFEKRVERALSISGEKEAITVDMINALPGILFKDKKTILDYLDKERLQIYIVNKEKVMSSFAEKERENLEMCSFSAARDIYRRYSGSGLEILSLFKSIEINVDVPTKYYTKELDAQQDITTIPLIDWEDISSGDLIVHEDFGIGIYRGFEKKKTALGVREYIILEYESSTKTLIPAERIDKLSKYIGDAQSVKISTPGGARWKNTKKKVEENIRERINELVKIYAIRQEQKGLIINGDSETERKFRETFPYIETTDQERAIEQIESDLISEKTMDRLLVGDAGFGKTEVAMRAAFKTVLSDYQVLMLAPTTILAKQHFDSFCERMNEFGVRIELLDRYKTQREKEEIYKQVSNGAVDIVIGTHALFSKKLIFKKLGLVIIDEEQRFGVLQKERFKSISEGVNFLLMSATPIPRTLYMSVSGLRDISTISTPPIGRLPVQTFVGNYSERIVRTAVLREKLRGGQILYVHNRVQDIDKIYKKLKETIPEVSISCAHGRMKKSDFSRILQEFYSGKLDMLVATTIVENGIDIPNANTLIVDDSQRYGISQLYQIKGRVGRSNKRAFAYFMHTSSVLNHDARKRLEAIKEFNEPGSGLRLALRDLEIRGYGDILGLDQKGHINSVGLQLYKSILDRVLSQLYNDKDVVRDSDFITEIKGIKGSIIIPEEYIENPIERMRIYRRISVARNISEVDELYSEIADRFGRMPCETERLIEYARIKVMAALKNIREIEIEDAYIKMKYVESFEPDPIKIRKFSKKSFQDKKNEEYIVYGNFDEVKFLKEILGE